MQEADLPDVLEIERQGHAFPWTETIFLDSFRGNYRLWTGWHGERLVGFAVVAYLFDEAHLLNLCVSPELHGQGIGRKLLRYLLGEAALDHIWRVILEVRVSNESAFHLYRSEGFRQIGTRPEYYPAADGREDARVMALELRD
ncbi:ribosomal protein S18-alanine N-acetyltransferase [Marinobacter salinisoli]|uniref:[Ribosomal protein bS18]-alanine N-acetyltransferase n=2 Tax=Marinobacter salinisoli TaxID=2769486 RepID=A0ABX7N2A0_9GAMM|nr:ribosomal protein S18-alanine N-acetyltransferase [Marinobacter salinisoli]QSP96498.1 ribosomal protein S18-alanine N-acetyltransferase [Marinobacter salinisoli]